MVKDKSELTELKNEFIELIINSMQDNTFVKFTLGKYRGKEDGIENIFIAPVKLKDDVKYSFRYKYKTRDVYKNYDITESADLIADELGNRFLSGTLFSTKNDFVLEYNKKRVPRTFTRKASFSKVEIKEHNRIKTRYIDSRDKYLNLLGITNAKGEVRGEKYDKFRQVDKFVEILQSLIVSSPLAESPELNILDLGSGKSYLTFAVYSYINSHGKKTHTTGVEQREDLVNLSNQFAAECNYNDLKFIKGSINEVSLKNADIVIALHACDTATDDAIQKAIELKAKIIVLAPCCQKYVRKHFEIPDNLKPVFKYGILEEHLSSFLTDGLRSLTLEALGYETKIFEFISGEHTNKNIMITAVKKDETQDNYISKVVEIEKMKSLFSLSDFYLDKLLIKKQ
ncbi:MAG: SAM-dependent methyltransferase [Ignavibacteria bacterium]|nr:SAM-dependent methyltransferase [Ignavibacteria bacterium]